MFNFLILGSIYSNKNWENKKSIKIENMLSLEKYFKIQILRNSTEK